jgi:putative membrane protein
VPQFCVSVWTSAQPPSQAIWPAVQAAPPELPPAPWLKPPSAVEPEGFDEPQAVAATAPNVTNRPNVLLKTIIANSSLSEAAAQVPGNPAAVKSTTVDRRPTPRYDAGVRLLLNWLVSAVSLWLVGQIVGGFEVKSLGWALVAVLVIGLVNATLGILLKILTFPLTIVTLGIFWWVINAMMLLVASSFVPGLRITGFVPAFIGAIVLALVNALFQWLLPRRDRPGER